MTFNQILLILGARKSIIGILAGLVVLVAAVVSLALPKQYTATGAVLFDVKIDPIVGSVLPGAALPSYMSTQVDLVRSERVMRKVISRLKLDEAPELRASWQEATGGVPGTFESWLAELLLKNTFAEPARESNVINISFSGQSPEFSAAIVNAIIDSYIDTTLELRIEPARRFNAQFSAQAQVARERLELAKAKMSEFQRRSGLTSSDERLDVESARLAELSAQLTVAQSAAADASSRSSVAVGASERFAEAQADPVVARLNSELALAQARLKETQSRLGDAHPEVQQLKASIAELRNRVSAEVSKVSGTLGSNVRVSQSRVAALRAAVEAQRQRVLGLKAQQDQISVLAKDVEAAQASYDRILARLDQTALESQTSQTNVSVVKRASTPYAASGPNHGRNIGLAVVVGLLFGLGTAFLLEMIDRRLRSKDDVDQLVGLPVLVSMPADPHSMSAFKGILPGPTGPGRSLPLLGNRT